MKIMLNNKRIGLQVAQGIAVVFLLFFVGCTQDGSFSINDSALSAINISANYPAMTRATDSGFEDGDVMGIFVVDYNSGEAGELVTEGNNADNTKFTYDLAENSWSSILPIYFTADTNIDIYGYYPYGDINDVNNYYFAVSSSQDLGASSTLSMGGYEASDLLWAKAENISPSSSVIPLTYSHLMAGVTITLKEGSGFSDGEWSSLSKSVAIKGTSTAASVDLSRGVVDVISGESKNIIPYSYNGEYKAIVVPQSVAAGVEVMGVMIDKVDYPLIKESEITYQSGKMHTFTVEVDKREQSGDYEVSIYSEAITNWVVDSEFYEGIVTEYIVVNVEQSGTLEQVAMDLGLVYDEVTALKITGEINDEDMSFAAGNFTNCRRLNLGESEYTSYGWNYARTDVISFAVDFNNILEQIIFPNNIKGISWGTPASEGLTGSLTIPEGVISLGGWNFFFCDLLVGELSLPSTLETIGDAAFVGSNLSGDLIIPDGVTYIGYRAFDSTNFSGTLRLPEGLTTICESSFSGMSNIRGDLVIPSGVEVVDLWAFSGSGFDGVLDLPEGLKIINSWAFHTSICGEVVFPESLLSIGDAAFYGTRITNIILPENLSVLGESAFQECSRLSSEITIPSKINAIEEKCFYECSMIPGIVLHEDVTSIGSEAFAYCNLITSIICMAETPPHLGTNAFYGVSLDDVTLQVPASSIEAYKRADGWKEFSRITEYSDFVCRPLDVCALNSAKEMEIILNADAEWSVESMPDWCTLSHESGSSKTSIMLVIDELAQGADDRVGVITFKSTSDEGNEVSTSCTISQYDYQYAENEVITLQNATVGKGVNVIFIGEGYDAESISNGSYMSMIEEQTANFFGVEPFTTYQDYFTVKAAISLSQETGINTMSTYRDTCFETVYGGTEASSYCCSVSTAAMVVDESIIFDYLEKYNLTSRDQLTETLIIMVPNTTDYDGVTYLYDDGCTISICPPNESAYPTNTRGVLQKQACGFGFGKLADEQITLNSFIAAYQISLVEVAQSRGYYQNISVSSSMSEAPWSDLIFDESYSDIVDLYEGAYGYTRGIYRSESNSCMNYGIPYFNTISRREIVKRIGMYSGEWDWWNNDKFYQNDSRDWGASSN